MGVGYNIWGGGTIVGGVGCISWGVGVQCRWENLGERLRQREKCKKGGEHKKKSEENITKRQNVFLFI